MRLRSVSTIVIAYDRFRSFARGLPFAKTIAPRGCGRSVGARWARLRAVVRGSEAWHRPWRGVTDKNTGRNHLGVYSCNAMHCDRCHKPVPEDATIWRVSVGYSVANPPLLGAVQSWCATCASDHHYHSRHPAQPCDHCARPGGLWWRPADTSARGLRRNLPLCRQARSGSCTSPCRPAATARLHDLRQDVPV